MATVSHTIYSYYNPENREEVATRTTQAADETVDDSDAAWQTETSFPTRRLLKSAPRFVPATRNLHDWKARNNRTGANNPLLLENDTSSWYRSLTKNASTSTRGVPTQFAMPGTNVGTSSIGEDLPRSPPRRIYERRNKNNWFILRAIQSDPSSPPSTPSPAHTLADILARDPPSLPTQQKYSPPVWLALGPSNKGWAMLQNGGWREGEGLGPTVHRSASDEDIFTKSGHSPNTRIGSQAIIKREKQEVKWEDGMQEAPDVDVIDLTLSDAEGVELKDEVFDSVQEIVDAGAKPITRSLSSQTALLTPIPIVLKSDRLGIGLKAKTVGPYRASLKRVTHNAAAMASHILAAEQARINKTEFGRGRRGLARQKKKEQENRQKMLAYLNE